MSKADYIRDLRARIGPSPVNLIGAAGLLLDDVGRILLGRKTERDTWSIPGGNCELGEALEDTLRREVAEETGLLVQAAQLLEMHSGAHRHYKIANGDEYFMYTALYHVTRWSGTPQPDGLEMAELRFFGLSDLPPLSGYNTRRAAELALTLMTTNPTPMTP